MSETSDTQRLDSEQRRRLRALGWRWVGRSRSKRPRPIRRRDHVDVETDDALVDLAARV